MKKYLILLLLLLLLLTGCKKKYDGYYYIKIGDDVYSTVRNVVVYKDKITFYYGDSKYEIINPENVIIARYDR